VVGVFAVSHPLLAPPRFEGVVRLRDGRRLGVAEFGPASGRPLLWLHGTPGARRQIAPQARALAHERGVRIVSIERPGVGESTPHAYGALTEFAGDVEQLCESLGIGEFAIAGLSGGGAYALACAHELRERVVSVGVLSGIAPTVGPDAAEGGMVALTRAFAPLFHHGRRAVGGTLSGLIRVLEPLADAAVDLFTRVVSPADHALFEDAAMRLMFQEDLILAARHNFQAICLDLSLFARPWGFALGDVKVPVQLWHGDSDRIVPVEHGVHLSKRIPGSELRVRPGEGHLGSLGAAREVFDAIFSHWPRPPAEWDLTAPLAPRRRARPSGVPVQPS
jgi:pimeloyl-ACP methyl ester carboxylesterase